MLPEDIYARLERIEAGVLQLLERKKKVIKIVEPARVSLRELIAPYAGKYAPSMVEDFILYWTQTDTKGRELWQKKDAFEVGKRLATWARNNEKFDHQREARVELKKVDELPRQWHTEPLEEDEGFTNPFKK